MYVSKRLYLEISDGGCGELLVSFSRKLQPNGQPQPDTLESFPLKDECEWNREAKGGVDALVCHGGGRTPLAGARYRYKQLCTYRCVGDGGAPEVYASYGYVCTHGCRAGVPRRMGESHGGCS